MAREVKPFVHLAVDAVDLVVLDPEGRYDADHYDRYASFVEARDAAITSIEVMLDEGDYDDEEHRLELEQVLGILEPARSFDEAAVLPEYRAFLGRLESARTAAA